MNIAELQKKLKSAKLDGYLVTRNNMFLDQDIREDENLLQQLTGFSGSAGSLLILRNKAVLFVDGRYELQAPQQVNPEEIEVFCTKQISFQSWLHRNTCDLSRFRLGINPWCLSADETRLLENNCIKVISAPDFLPPLLSNQPAKVFEHQIEFSGQTSAEKLARIVETLKAEKTDAIFFTLADSVSWLFNLRSNALPETPILRAMALVDNHGNAWLFGDNLDTSGLKLDHPILALSEIPAILRKFKHKSISLDIHTNSFALQQLMLANQIEIIPERDKCQSYKAVKNSVELEGIRQAHIRDGVAVTKFLCWLEKNWQGKTERDIVTKLHRLRSEGEYYFSESFATIAASGFHGAIVHYQPTAETNRPLDNNSLLLLDSGAQYYDGTTDVTRTIALGSPTPQMIEDFTFVLKAHINLSASLFPAGTNGTVLDGFARQVLWRVGKDYNHGTGHGVGCFLNVHEGPLSLSRLHGYYGLQQGMITSIEPGYYKEIKYGIRIENLVEIDKADSAEFPEGYLKFKNLTLIPIDKRLINKYLLSDGEIDWLNTYHRRVEETLSPYLTVTEKTWLQEACSPL